MGGLGAGSAVAEPVGGPGAGSAVAGAVRAGRRLSPHRAVTVLFLVHAAVLGSWTPVIPGVTHALGLSTAQLGLALVAEPIGAGLVMVPAGALVARFGSRGVLAWSVLPYAASTAAIGLAPNLWTFAAALFVWGGSQGMTNIAINAQGVVVERSLGRAVLAGLHGWWSLGAFGGAVLGTFVVGRGVSPAVQLAVVGALALVTMSAVLPGLLPDASPREHTGSGAPGRDGALAEDVVAPGATTSSGNDGHGAARGRRRGPLVVRPSPRLLGLAAVAFCCLLCEGAVLTWSALFLVGTIGATAAVGGLGYAAYSLAMAGGRLSGDRVMARWGTTRVLSVAAAVGGTAVAGALLVRTLPAALVGFALLGLGLSCVMPLVTRAAAAASPQAVAPAIALVSSSGWLGVVAGPPLVGAVAAASSLGGALWVLVVLPLAVSVGTGLLLRPRPDDATSAVERPALVGGA